MDSKTIIEQFFDDQFEDTTRFFLYKDKQFLKNRDYAGFAKHRIKEARNIDQEQFVLDEKLFSNVQTIMEDHE